MNYILSKKEGQEPYIYIEGEDPNIPYCEVEHGSEFYKDGDVVSVKEIRTVLSKSTKYLEVGDKVTFNLYSGTILSEKPVSNDEWNYEDEFLIGNITNIITNDKIVDLYQKRKDLQS